MQRAVNRKSETFLKRASTIGNLVSLETRAVKWIEDNHVLRDLFAATWKKHPITTMAYFDWQFLQASNGKAIAYCATPDNANRFVAGIYVVIPTNIMVDGDRIPFSTSLYTMTHPDYYKRGIFVNLARLTYEQCLREGIIGTIGVPNSKSLPGFVKSLGFKSIGQFAVIGRVAALSRKIRNAVDVKELSSEQDLSQLIFDMAVKKAKSGLILAERSKEFIKWRFFRCPNAKYHVFVTTDKCNSVSGMLVLRFALRRGVPLTVVVDFMVDGASPEAAAIAAALLSRASYMAWTHLTPLIVTLVNPHSYEAQILSQNGFRALPKAILPHESNFIVKLHTDVSQSLMLKLHSFENWYFSFADYDIF
jgi:hypothetical protein